MPNRTSIFGRDDDPFTGSLQWVRVRDRDEVGKVVDGGKNVGSAFCCGVLFASTGQVCFYQIEDVTRCDADGNTSRPS